MDRARRLRAIGLIMITVTLFGALDTAAKWLVTVGGLSVSQTVYARYASNLLILLVFVNPWTSPGLFRGQRLGLQFVRALLLLGSTLMNFTAMLYLQLAEIVTIIFSVPFWTALLAGLFLGQWIGPRRWIAVLVGFVGVLIVARPGVAGAMHWAVVFSIGSAITYSSYNILSRVLAQTDSLKSMVLMAALVPTLALSPFVLPGWTQPEGWLPWVLMAFMGLCATIGHSLLVVAHRDVPAQDLAPFVYVQLVSMTGFGYLVFGDVPGPWVIVGGLVIVLSGLWLLALERKGVA